MTMSLRPRVQARMQTRLLLESGDTLARRGVGGMVLWWDMEQLPRERVGPGCSCLGREMVTGTNSGEKANFTPPYQSGLWQVGTGEMP